MIDWIIYLGIGKILIFLWQRFPLKINNEFLTKLHECDLCSGFWLFLILAFAFRSADFINLLGLGFYYPVLNQTITAGVSTFIVWLIAAGWREKFSVVIIK